MQRFESARRLQLNHSAPSIYESSAISTVIELGNIWEQLPLQVADRCPVRVPDDVGVDIEGRLDRRVPELLLGDLRRHPEVVKQ